MGDEEFKASVWGRTRDEVEKKYGAPHGVEADPTGMWDGPFQSYKGEFKTAKGERRTTARLYFSQGIVALVDFS